MSEELTTLENLHEFLIEKPMLRMTRFPEVINLLSIKQKQLYESYPQSALFDEIMCDISDVISACVDIVGEKFGA